jgi:hypothetical protein
LTGNDTKQSECDEFEVCEAGQVKDLRSGEMKGGDFDGSVCE